MVRQVYIAQKMTPVGMIMYKKIIRENTIFVKKNSGKKKIFIFTIFTWNRQTIVLQMLPKLGQVRIILVF